jgi:hypothetical protein
MIIDKNIKIKITRQNLEHFSKFFKVNLRDVIYIEPEKHLQQNSNIHLNVKCDLCNNERYIKFQAYSKNINSSKKYPIYTCDKCSHIKLKETNKDKYGYEYYSQHPDRNERVKKTCLDKYGVEHYSKTNKYIYERNQTNLEKFGYINPFMDKERIKNIFKEKYGVEHPALLTDDDGEYVFFKNTWTLKADKTEWMNYKTDVRRLTKHNIKLLDWDGTDFYDGEYIKNNFNIYHLDSNYPTIDHKISIYEGFLKNMSIEVISSVDNLCWTKRIINITKNKKSELF